MDKSTFDSLNAWRLRGTVDYMQLFLNLWIGFNGWFSLISQKQRDRDGIEWVKNYSGLKRLYEAKVLIAENDVQEVAAYLDARPVKANSYWKGRINSQTSWEEMIEFLYTVRCNLFHGHKNPNDNFDRLIVELAYKCLDQVFLHIILDAQGITTVAEVKRFNQLHKKYRDKNNEFRNAVKNKKPREEIQTIINEMGLIQSEKKEYLKIKDVLI